MRLLEVMTPEEIDATIAMMEAGEREGTRAYRVVMQLKAAESAIKRASAVASKLLAHPDRQVSDAAMAITGVLDARYRDAD